MALICSIKPHVLPDGVSIVSSSFEVATDPHMVDIILFSYNDTVNKEAIVFDFEPESGRSYYGRVSSILTTGPLSPGPIVELKYSRDNNGMVLTTPSPVNTPLLTTKFWKTEHPPSCFTIEASGYEVIGNSTLSNVQWTITDILTGDVVHTYFDTLGTGVYGETPRLYVDVMLDHNRQYQIDAIFTGDNDSASCRGSIIISTSGRIVNSRNVGAVSTSEDTTIIKDSSTFIQAQHEWYLLDEDSVRLNPAGTELSNVSSFTIDHTLLEKGKTYVLQSREVSDKNPHSKYEYLIFRTTPETTFGLPGEFPYKLGIGSTETVDLDIESDKE